MLDNRTQKILLAIIKHCNVIEDTKKHLFKNYKIEVRAHVRVGKNQRKN